MKKNILFAILIAVILGGISVSFRVVNQTSNSVSVDDTYYMQNSRDNKDSETENGNVVMPPAQVSVFVEFKNADDFTDISQSQLTLFTEYFSRYYSSLGNYTAVDMSDLFYFDTDYQRSLITTMTDYQIRIRENMSIDLTYETCNVGIEFRSIEETKNGIRISLYENNYMNYAFCKDVTSYTSGVEHVFTIKEATGKYYIVTHSEITGVYSLITEKFESMLERERLTLSALTKSQLVSLFDELNEYLVLSADQGLENLYYERAKYNFNPERYVLETKADNPYNAEQALAYSYEWAGKYEMKRNPRYFAYDEYGGNCNNFTSQCLFSSGIPMDLSGDIYHQWKWYGDDINGYSTAYGRTMSWTGVEFFWQYCSENNGRGIVADCSSNVYSGRPGDIIQYVNEGVGVHSVIITKVIYDENGYVIDYLINSNTTDKVDCPMSIYGYTDFRLIRIAGWNN
ncbi:MAG: amidase domain-containing protein [Clostridia bacterium]|nr:amidase domain-containing protein [Clostridia bacterium]